MLVAVLANDFSIRSDQLLSGRWDSYLTQYWEAALEQWSSQSCGTISATLQPIVMRLDKSITYTVLGGGAGAVVVCVAVNELTIVVVLPKFNQHIILHIE